MISLYICQWNGSRPSVRFPIISDTKNTAPILLTLTVYL